MQFFSFVCKVCFLSVVSEKLKKNYGVQSRINFIELSVPS
jgi:hypothetical protein